MHLDIADFRLVTLFPSISSDTILVAARFIPEFANVEMNIYIDIISSKTPAPSAPSLFAIYTLKMKLIELMKSEVRLKIIVLKMKCFNLLIW